MDTSQISGKKSPNSEEDECTISVSNESEQRYQASDINKEAPEPTKLKKKSKRKIVCRKNKPSPVLKVDEDTVTTCTSDNTTNTPEDSELFGLTNSLMGSNSSSEDDSLLTHIVLSQILNAKKLELMESEEVINALTNKI